MWGGILRRCFKNWLSLFILTSFIASQLFLPAESAAYRNAVASVFLHDADGNDGNDGLSPGKPLKSLAAAVNRVNELGLEGEERVIEILACGWNGMSFDMSECIGYSEMITLKSSVTVWSVSDMKLAGPVTVDMSYGNSVTQRGLDIYTFGHQLILGEKADDKKGITVIFAGYSYEQNNLPVDPDTGYIEYGADISVTVKSKTGIHFSVSLGNTDIGNTPVQYGNAEIVIDAPDAVLQRLYFGNRYNSGSEAGTRMNRYNNFFLLVNGISDIGNIVGGTYYNGSIAENVCFIFNNGTYDSVSKDYLTFGKYHESMFSALRLWKIKSSQSSPPAALRESEQIGTFIVSGIAKAEAISESLPDKKYISNDGVLNMPAGIYNVSYFNSGDYIFDGDVLTACNEIASLDLDNIAQVQKAGSVFVGWKNEEEIYLDNVSEVPLKKGEKLFAVYAELDMRNSDEADFAVKSTEIRTEKSIGLRFIIEMSDRLKTFSEKFDFSGLGYLIMPEYYADKGENLDINSLHAVKGDCLNGQFAYYDDSLSTFTVCVTGIIPEHYNEKFEVRGYLQYTDYNGNTQTAYTETVGCSLLEVSADYLRKEQTESGIGNKLDGIVEKGLEYSKNKLLSGVKNNPDTLGKTGGTVYYISEDGNDSASGTSEESAWRTLKRLNEADLNAGDTVLFGRGGNYRVYSNGREHMSVELVSGVSYGAYGSGQKPIINGSIENYAERSWRKLSGTEHIYYIDLGYAVDPGVLRVTTNQNYSYTGTVRDSLTALGREWDFYWDGSKLYMYCQYAHPNSLLKDIEVGFGCDIFKIDGQSEIKVENLAFANAGRHAIGGLNYPSEITVRGCEFSYIGGSLINDYQESGIYTRLGNAVEFLGGSTNILVEQCSFYSIYDSGVTFQGGSKAGISHNVRNFTVNECVFEKCGLASFEYWLGYEGTADNIQITNNYMADAGSGHGGVKNRTVSSFGNAHIRADGINIITGFRVENNVFDSSVDGAGLLFLSRNTDYGGNYPEFYGNIYKQITGKLLISLSSLNTKSRTDIFCDSAAFDRICAGSDPAPVLIYGK